MSTDHPATGFWQRQRERVAAVRELYREWGVLVLSPAVIGMWLHKKKLLTEVQELNLQREQSFEKLMDRERKYWEERLKEK